MLRKREVQRARLLSVEVVGVMCGLHDVLGSLGNYPNRDRFNLLVSLDQLGKTNIQLNAYIPCEERQGIQSKKSFETEGHSRRSFRRVACLSLQASRLEGVLLVGHHRTVLECLPQTLSPKNQRRKQVCPPLHHITSLHSHVRKNTSLLDQSRSRIDRPRDERLPEVAAKPVIIARSGNSLGHRLLALLDVVAVGSNKWAHEVNLPSKNRPDKDGGRQHAMIPSTI